MYLDEVVMQVETAQLLLIIQSGYLRDSVTVEPQAFQSGVFIEAVDFIET